MTPPSEQPRVSRFSLFPDLAALGAFFAIFFLSGTAEDKFLQPVFFIKTNEETSSHIHIDISIRRYIGSIK